MHEKWGCPIRIVWSTLRGIVSGLFGGAAIVGGNDLLTGKTPEEAWDHVVIDAPFITFNCGLLMFIYTMLECTLEFARDIADAGNSFVAGAITGAIYGAAGGPDQMLIWSVIFSVVCGILDGVY